MYFIRDKKIRVQTLHHAVLVVVLLVLLRLALRLFVKSNNDDTTIQYASGNLTPIELLHVHREGEGERVGEEEGEGEGVVVKTLSSSCEPPRAWARERRSKQASPCSTS